MKRISDKRKVQLAEEKELTNKLLIKQCGLCARCGRWPDWRGLSKHEKIFRSQGGDPTDEEICELIRGRCHASFHGIREVKSEVQWSNPQSIV